VQAEETHEIRIGSAGGAEALNEALYDKCRKVDHFRPFTISIPNHCVFELQRRTSP
jgi:hypothetical protein